MYIKPIPYRCPDGQARWTVTGTAQKSMALTRSDTMVGLCLGRYLGTAARHGYDTTLGEPDLNPLKLCPPNPNFSTQLSPLSTAAASLFQISSLLPSSRSPPSRPHHHHRRQRLTPSATSPLPPSIGSRLPLSPSSFLSSTPLCRFVGVQERPQLAVSQGRPQLVGAPPLGVLPTALRWSPRHWERLAWLGVASPAIEPPQLSWWRIRGQHH
jgi:hypothetical protein